MFIEFDADGKEVYSMGLKLRELRVKLGISQEKLAKMSGVSRITISEIESGKRVNITTNTLLSLVRALGTTIDAIFFS